MANVMMNHPDYCYLNPVGMQYIGDEDEAISQPIERLPFQSAAEPEREIVDVDTLERKPTDGDTAVVVRGLVIEKARTDVSFCYVGCAYCKKRMVVDDHGNLRCERHACVKDNTYFLVRVRFVESATGRSIWLTLFDQCMVGLLDVDARLFSYERKHADVQAEHFGRGHACFSPLRKVNETATTSLRLHACVLFQAELQTSNEVSICAHSTSPVPSSSYSTTDVTTDTSDCATTTTNTTTITSYFLQFISARSRELILHPSTDAFSDSLFFVSQLDTMLQ